MSGRRVAQPRLKRQRPDARRPARKVHDQVVIGEMRPASFLHGVSECGFAGSGRAAECDSAVRTAHRTGVQGFVAHGLQRDELHFLAELAANDLDGCLRIDPDPHFAGFGFHLEQADAIPLQPAAARADDRTSVDRVVEVAPDAAGTADDSRQRTVLNLERKHPSVGGVSGHLDEEMSGGVLAAAPLCDLNEGRERTLLLENRGGPRAARGGPGRRPFLGCLLRWRVHDCPTYVLVSESVVGGPTIRRSRGPKYEWQGQDCPCQR